MTVHQFPTMRACYTPPPADIEPIDTLSDPIVGENLDAAQAIVTWLPISIAAWAVIFGLYWVLG